MPTKKKLWVAAGVGAFCVAQVVVLCIFIGRSLNRADAEDSREQAATKTVALAGGAAIQRKRIDAAIENASGLSLEEAEASLNVIDEHLNLAISSGQSGSDFGPPSKVHQLLADRRFAKIYEFYKGMPAAEACGRASKLFDRNLALHKADLDRCIARLRGEDKSSDSIPVTGNYHALSASLFLSAVFCQQPEFLQNVDEWQSVVGTMYREGATDPVLAPLLVNGRDEGPPQNLMLLNLYVLVLERDKKIGTDELRMIVKKRLPDFRSIPLSAWDAHTSALDFTHIHRGVAYDEKKSLATFNLAIAWGSAAVTETEENQLIQAVRSVVQAKERLSGK